MNENEINKDQKILDVKNLSVRFETEEGIVRAVNGIDLELGYHRTLGLVGETGAGKTTTALALLRLVQIPPGVVECDKLEIGDETFVSFPWNVWNRSEARTSR